MAGLFFYVAAGSDVNAANREQKHANRCFNLQIGLETLQIEPGILQIERSKLQIAGWILQIDKLHKNRKRLA